MRRWFGVFVLGVSAAAGLHAQVDFATQIQPLFTKYGCAGCHGGNGGLFVTTYNLLMTTGNDGPVVVPGDTNSLIVLKLKGTATIGARMPFGGDPIDQADLNLIIQWIKEGATESVATGVKRESSVIPDSPVLAQNYPNPFNPSTTISFGIPDRGRVTLDVYAISGELVTRLVDGEYDPGVYHVSFDARELSSGIYLYRLKAGSFVDVKRMILMR